eukprot:1155928-Pelagomonas_calceolata.AAC.3
MRALMRMPSCEQRHPFVAHECCDVLSSALKQQASQQGGLGQRACAAQGRTPAEASSQASLPQYYESVGVKKI